MLPRHVGPWRLPPACAQFGSSSLKPFKPRERPRSPIDRSLRKPITWLRLVDGRWVFVAYSNDEISRIACWDLLATQTEAIAEGFLSGRVESARVETQDNGIVLALALGGHQSGVLVTTLRKKGEKYAFYELARVEQSSHVLMLSGTILGCAVLGDANVPHLVDWENKTVYEIPAPPGELDTPERRSVPHLIAIQNDILVVVRHTGVEVYHSHPSFQQPMSFLRLIPVSSIWEAVVVPAPTTRLHLLLLTSHGIESVTVDEHDSHEISCIARSPKCYCFIEDPRHPICDGVPWWRLLVGPSGRRCLWVSAASHDDCPPYIDPYFVTMALPLCPSEPDSETAAPNPISWSAQSAESAALWALPCVDFDDALGITVVGTCFGELAIYSFDDALRRALPLLPGPLCGPSPTLDGLPELSFKPSTLPRAEDLRHASPCDLVDCTFCSVDDYYARVPSTMKNWAAYPDISSWQGFPGDYAWILDNVYGFPGQIVPHAYIPDDDTDELLFRVGKRGFTFREDSDGTASFLSWGDPALAAMRAHHSSALYSRSDVIKKSHLFSCFNASSESFCWEAPTTRSHAIIDTTWTSIKSCAARDNLPFPPSMWFGSLLALLALAGSVSAASRVKESVFAPRGWIQHSAAPADHIVKLRIALPQPNFPALEDALYAVSDPAHERYGAHLSKEQVEELIAPHAESVEAVNEWLYSHGIQDSDIARSSAGDWLTIRLPVALVEGMLDTKYHVWKNIKNGEYLVRTTSYSLPEHLHQHIELIQPTTLFGSFRRLTSTIYSKTPVHASSQDGPSSLARIVDPKTGISVDASCNQTITISCLKQIYNAVDYKTRGKGSVAVTGYLGEFANRQDLQSLFKAEVPAAVGTTFKFISVNNGTDPQDPEDAGGEGKHMSSARDLASVTILSSQFAFGLSFPVPSTFYSTAGSPPFIPDLGTPTDTNEPYTEWLDFILNQKEPPSVVSTSYEDDEQSVPLSFAQRACAGFAQLGARGTSLTFSSGDGGVGDGDPDPATQECFTNDGTNRTRFLAGFPSSCPFTTSVGGTFLFPETAVPFSGGGFSNYFARPSYQKAAVQKFLDGLAPGTYAGLFNATGRAFPDVSAQSVNFTVWVGGEEFLIGGTSASAPAFAGFIALLNDARISKGQKPLGFLNPLIYGLGGKGFFDITTGNNPGCGTEGFNATVGWDAVTGLGTPNFGELVKLVIDT
uniref:Peptidase S53 domain-containing protein n=1 Tax=Mycena chlorophos TaxID=658473 RepID=A0ABQ0LUG9_MYCCL|nr:predicted protein [Mycena chlorophos]